MVLTVDPINRRRLIVLIPGWLVNNVGLAHEIHWMADREHRAVLYVVLVTDNDNMLTISRDLATMKAVTSANRLAVESKQIEIENWFPTLSKIVCPGDVIVCQEEQMVVVGFLKQTPVSELLSSRLTIPVRTISGYYNPFKPQLKLWLHGLITTAGFLAIIAVFTWLEIRFGEAFDGPEQTILVMIAFFGEMAVLLAWNKLSYR